MIKKISLELVDCLRRLFSCKCVEISFSWVVMMDLELLSIITSTVVSCPLLTLFDNFHHALCHLFTCIISYYHFLLFATCYIAPSDLWCFVFFVLDIIFLLVLFSNCCDTKWIYHGRLLSWLLVQICSVMTSL